MCESVHVHQARLLEEVWYSLGGRAPTAQVRDAFFAVPRHLFVERYCTLAVPQFREVTATNLVEHLPAIYSNDALGIHYIPGDPQVATISAPWLVLDMLELLDLSPGQRVFELGTGSGWNAGLIGHLVGPDGLVETIEILPDLVDSARRGLARAGIGNVRVVLGDGSSGPGEVGEPFDRAVFTAGASDLPRALFAAVRPGGKLLFVLAIPGGGNVLILFERRGSGFESLVTRRCTFVPVTGRGSSVATTTASLESIPDWAGLSRRVIEQRSFAISVTGPTVQDRSVDLRSYLWLVDPGFRVLVDRDGHQHFGIYDGSTGSLALVHAGRWTVFGSIEAGNRLRQHLHAWVDLGMPGLADMEVTAVPTGRSDHDAADPGWRLECPTTSFRFRLPAA